MACSSRSWHWVRFVFPRHDPLRTGVPTRRSHARMRAGGPAGVDEFEDRGNWRWRSRWVRFGNRLALKVTVAWVLIPFVLIVRRWPIAGERRPRPQCCSRRSRGMSLRGIRLRDPGRAPWLGPTMRVSGSERSRRRIGFVFPRTRTWLGVGRPVVHADWVRLGILGLDSFGDSHLLAFP